MKSRPPLDEILNLHDFEVHTSMLLRVPSNSCVKTIAKEVMTQKAWAYYSSAADDEVTNRENHLAYQRLVFDMTYIYIYSNMTRQNLVSTTCAARRERC
jgi:L-lactate dehydrogenase (cytochrome)